MALTLHYHPLSSFCWKALVGLYELDVPFEKHLVDLGNDAARASFLAIGSAFGAKAPRTRYGPSLVIVGS